MKKKLALSQPSISMEVSPNGQHLDLFLIGYVGDWGNDIKTFLYQMRQYPNVQTIDVYINSLGGSFYDGLPIFNFLKMHTAYVTTKVIGYACSMASYIMLAGDEIQAAQNAIIMIHRAQGVCIGNANDMVKAAEILTTHEEAAIPEYASRLQLSNDEVFTLLSDETWYFSKKALDDGLIDSIIDTMAIENAGLSLPIPAPDDYDLLTENAAKYALQHYKNIPTDIKQRLQSATDLKAKPSLFQKLFTGKKQKPVPTNSLTLTEDIDMTKEEFQTALQANNVQLLADVAKMIKPESPQAEPKDELAELKTQIATLTLANTELSATVTTLADAFAAAMNTSDAVELDVSLGAANTEAEKW